MRIAYVIPVYPPSTFVANEVTEVIAAGHDVLIMPLHGTRRSQICKRLSERLSTQVIFPSALCDAKVLCLAFWMLLSHPFRVLKVLLSAHGAAGLNPFAHAGIIAVTPKALATAWRASRAEVDRLHAHFATHTTTCAAIAGLVSGIPFSFTAHAYDIYCTSLAVRNDTLQWKLRHAIQVFAVSQYGAKLLRRQLPPHKRGRVQTVYVGIPLEVFRMEPPPAVDGQFRLLCIGNFEEKKGIDTLIDACALLHDRGISFRLDIYGNGLLREALDERISRLGLEEHVFLGSMIPQEEVARQMATCHLFVMPCRKSRIGNMDGIPTVFMEAMATGRPVVSCPISGIPELVRDGETGLLVPTDDPSALAEAVARLIADEGLRLELGRKARALVERQHSQQVNARRLLEFMKSVPAISERGYRHSACESHPLT